MSEQYAIRAGDTLWHIAEKKLGDAMRWTEIYNRNMTAIGANPNFLRAGLVLELPKPAEKTPEKCVK